MDSNNNSPYERQLSKQLDHIWENAYNNINNITTIPYDKSVKIFKLLIQYACSSQNIAAIELGRKKIKEINIQWVNKELPIVANQCICFDDEWQYRRLLELVKDINPELLEWAISLGVNSINEEVREAAEDFSS